MKKILIIFSLLVALTLFSSCHYTQQKEVDETSSKAFINDGLSTNTSKKSIDLNLVLDGGPGKDGIPAINEPKFLTISDAKADMSYLKDDSKGIAVNIDNEAKFYPFDILVWHEIVNDTLGGKEISVTFCPLCGSSIVFDRAIDGDLVTFGVSGKLYESNLLMYDSKTESLWSQSLGESVVGDYTGKKLNHIDADMMSLKEFEENFENGLVLSDNTGKLRLYGKAPYGDYENNETLYFPVNNAEDARLPKKEIMYIVNNSGESVAFVLDDLVDEKEAILIVGENEYMATYNNGKVDILLNGEVLPGYFEMWFSWINHNQNSKNIWMKTSK